MAVMAAVSRPKRAPSTRPRLWTTRSLQDALFQRPRGPGHPCPMRLPYPSPDDGQMIWCSLGELAAASAEAWTAGLFAAVVQLDHVDNDYRTLRARAEAAERANAAYGIRGRLKRALTRAEQECDQAEGELTRLFEKGLEARLGHRLDEEEQRTYAQIAARLLPITTVWHVCERCDIVFRAERRAARDANRCRACKSTRIPRLRPAMLRECVACSALFEPADLQQSTCRRCRAEKSTRSRHPDRPVAPGTPHRRATVEVDLLLDGGRSQCDWP